VDPRSFAKGLAQKIGRARAAVRNDVDVHGYIIHIDVAKSSRIHGYIMHHTELQ
jgi:hypothetical protein